MTTEPRLEAAPCEPLPARERTLPAMLRRAAEHAPERALVRIGGGAWSCREAVDAAARSAAWLRAAGVERGDRVALMCSNRIEFLEAFVGCGWLGAIAVPINTASMGPQIEYLLADSGARLLVIEAGWLDRLALVDPARIAQLQAVHVVGDAPPGAQCAGVPCRAWSIRHATADATSAPPPQPGDTLAILYTSGTTGPAKGVTCPHAQYHWWGVHSARVLGVGAADVLCTTLPLFHINALNTLAQALLSGAQVVYETRFSASGFWPAMRAADASVVYLLGAMVPMLLAQAQSAAERDHRVRIGLGPGVPAAAAEAFEARCGVRLLEGYGSTETNFVIACAADHTPRRGLVDDTPRRGLIDDTPRRGVMGWLQPGFDARVVDADDVELPPGEAGELLLRADEPYAFATGYHGMPEQTVAAWRNLWFHTGDRVVREGDGAFRFIDRIKDAIRRRGENISSFEVEQVLHSHPAVATAAVYPVRSELAEDEVMAALVLREGQQAEPAELARYCEARLPYFAVPRYIEIVAELPRTANGKVQKYRLRERGVTAATWERPQAAARRTPATGEGSR